MHQQIPLTLSNPNELFLLKPILIYLYQFEGFISTIFVVQLVKFLVSVNPKINVDLMNSLTLV